MFIQRISCIVSFITEALNKIPPFIKLCILPELVGKWFKQPAEPSMGPLNEVVLDVVHDSLDGTSNVTTTKVDDTVSTTVTVTSDVPTSTQDSLQVLDEDSGQDSEEDDTLWCYCKQNLQEELVSCDNPSCKIKWFHLSCL